MATKAFPVREIAPGTYEIDEFDCASVFLIVGAERALLIDTGSGIGDLGGKLAELTDRPITLVMTHGHGDHAGGLGWFAEYRMHPADWGLYDGMLTVESRRGYASFIAKRSGLTYPYDPIADIRPWPADAHPRSLPLADGEVFDLGGRVVSAHHCPGHTPGSMVFLDEANSILLIGDACNCNMLLAGVPGMPGFISVERALEGLKRVAKLNFTSVFNSHHDFRPFGEPLDPNVLPDVIGCCEDLVSGNYRAETVPGMFPGNPDRTVVRRGTVMVTFREEGIREPR